MIIRASGRLTLVLAAGLLLASPLQAATDGDESTSNANSADSTAAPVVHRTFRHASHHKKHYARHRLHGIATKNDADRNTDTDKKVPIADAPPVDNKAKPNIPPSIANANAQMLLANAQVNAAAAIPAGSEVPPAQASDGAVSASPENGTFMVAADQLNDVDRTLQENNPTPAAATNSPPAPITAMTGESTAWDQTSLIGKIFIGFGALLTMASAARMFIT
jgi:hypothetical protein